MPSDASDNHRLAPLAYHEATRHYLRREEPDIWQWYASNRVRREQADSIRFDLLKSTYRLDRDSHGELYDTADSVAAKLELEAPVTLYQAQNAEGLNASLAYMPDEAHVVLCGPVAAKLTNHELRALFAHELGHFLFYDFVDGDLLVAEQILAAMTHDREADTPHFASARYFGLYTEVYCDRVALSALGQPGDVISMLVKITTGLDDVNPTSYLKQADEILQRGAHKSEGISHPEAYIRAHALQLWHEQGASGNARLAELIEGSLALDALDLIGQVRVTELTRGIVDLMLSPKWLQSDVILAHARLFFDDYSPPTSANSGQSLRDALAKGDDALRDYFCYVLLDFTSADRDLEEAPLAHAIEVAETLGLNGQFAQIAVKELRLRKKQFEKIAGDRAKIIAAAAKEDATT